MARKSVKSLTIDQNVRCHRIYPVKGSERSIEELVTIGFALTKEQAIHLARVLLAATQEWDTINVTGFRLQERSDGTFPITVTNFQKSKAK
ncbi:MAG: hypothetical protein WB992_26010 [Bryobacteraceae bacterium]